MPWDGASCPSAANSALVTIWLVSVLPATTGAGKARAQHRAFGNADFDRAKATGVERNGYVGENPEDIEHGSAGHGCRSVETCRLLGRRAGEIDDCGARGGVDRDRNLDDRALVCFDAKVAAFQLGQKVADRGFAVIEDVGHVAGDVCEPELDGER